MLAYGYFRVINILLLHRAYKSTWGPINILEWCYNGWLLIELGYPDDLISGPNTGPTHTQITRKDRSTA